MMQPASKVEQVIVKVRLMLSELQLEGDRLPSEPELARILKASRSTVRQAVERLVQEGLITRKHGVGTFVNQRVLNIQTRLEEVWDFDEMIRISGHTPSVRNVNIALCAPEAEIARKLLIDPQSEVLIADNIFLANNVPVIVCRDIIPAGLIQSAYREEELAGPVYSFLEHRCRQRLVYTITEVLPVAAEVELSRYFNCQVGTALHYFEEIGYNAEDVPIIYSAEYYRPEYFSFKVIRKLTTAHAQAV